MSIIVISCSVKYFLKISCSIKYNYIYTSTIEISYSYTSIYTKYNYIYMSIIVISCSIKYFIHKFNQDTCILKVFYKLFHRNNLSLLVCLNYSRIVFLLS